MRQLLEIGDAFSDFFNVFQIYFVSLYVLLVILAFLEDCQQLLFAQTWTISTGLKPILFNAGQRIFNVLHNWTFAIWAIICLLYFFFFLFT